MLTSMMVMLSMQGLYYPLTYVSGKGEITVAMSEDEIKTFGPGQNPRLNHDTTKVVFWTQEDNRTTFLAHILPAPTVTGSELQDWLEWGNGPWFQTTQTRTASVFGRNNYGYGTDVAHLVGIRSRNHWTFYVQYCQGDDLDNLYITGVRRLR